MKYDFDDIVITGYSCITAAGVGTSPILSLLDEGRSALVDIPDDITGGISLKWGRAAFFKATDYMPPLKARKMDRSSQLAFAVTGLALKEAGIDTKALDPEKIGIAMGCGFGGVGNSSEFLTGYFNAGVEGLAPMLFPNTVSNAAASNASIEHGLKGPNITMVQRFCSAESALLMACRFLQQGQADIMLAGGIDELNPLIIRGFMELGQHRQYGSCFSEGCGVIVLETAKSASDRNARVLATVKSISSIGLMPDSSADVCCRELLGDCSGISSISLSGTTVETKNILNRLPDCSRIDIAAATGRSLAMGATAMACFASCLQPSERGLHLASSPEGPFFAIRIDGGCSDAR